MKNEIAIFAGGCFWCTEALIKKLRGVVTAFPGYIGGEVKNPTYMDVGEGNTGHAEAVKIEYDPNVISYGELLSVFFNTHDPTTLNRQGNDVGTQYRSEIFYTTEEQKKEAEDLIKELNENNSYPNKVVTAVTPASEFYIAESYHHDYYEQNKNKAYCQLIIAPKLEKLQIKYANLINH